MMLDYQHLFGNPRQQVIETDRSHDAPGGLLPSSVPDVTWKTLLLNCHFTGEVTHSWTSEKRVFILPCTPVDLVGVQRRCGLRQSRKRM